MKLVSFSVTNFRSITRAYKLPIGQITILVGPNNEGKSNILLALVTALQLLSHLGGIRIFRHSRFRMPHEARGVYDWETDFPMSLQNESRNGESVFALEFELTQSEIERFRDEVKSNLNGTLPIQISMGLKEPSFKVLKRGPGGPALSKKAQGIARFIAKSIDIKHIPAVRTAQSARRIVEAIVEKELAIVENEPAYKDALTKVAEIQAPVLDKISNSIQITLKEFLPNVKKVKVLVSEEDRYRALRSCQMWVDDGTLTELARKGDGVQSLAALSLMRYSSEGILGRELLLAIEEPESHLHPAAIQQLKKVLTEIALKNQVIMTSHCPLFVNRSNIQSNIIVYNNKAVPAKNMREIRKILGIRAADNLQHAELILLVEGEDDRKALTAILSNVSSLLRYAFSDGRIAIDSLMGGGNLSYKLGQVREVMCLARCFLDYDKSGLQAFQKAESEGLIMPTDVTFSSCEGLIESEMEDLYDVSLYAPYLLNRYSVSLEDSSFKGKNKWSERIARVFKRQGQVFSNSVEMRIKNDIADIVVTNPANAINEHKITVIEALVRALETKLKR